MHYIKIRIECYINIWYIWKRI